MKKLVLCLLLALAVMPLVPSTSEARCGRLGCRSGRIRAWFQAHRPHLLHRGGCCQ